MRNTWPRRAMARRYKPEQFQSGIETETGNLTGANIILSRGRQNVLDCATDPARLFSRSAVAATPGTGHNVRDTPAALPPTNTMACARRPASTKSVPPSTKSAAVSHCPHPGQPEATLPPASETCIAANSPAASSEGGEQVHGVLLTLAVRRTHEPRSLRAPAQRRPRGRPNRPARALSTLSTRSDASHSPSTTRQARRGRR